MAGKIIILIVCIIAAMLTFRGEWILKTFTKSSDVSERAVRTLKYTALGLAVAAFAAVFLMY